MKLLKVAALSVAMSLASLVAHAGTFQFSYSFDPANTGNGDPVALSGTFTGDQVGSSISNISNIQVFLNGTAFQGPILAEGWNASTQSWDNSVAAVVSLDVAGNSFVFADTDVSVNPGASNYFWIQGGSVAAVDFNSTDANNNALSGYENAVASRWSVSPTAAVPEPDSLALMAAGLGVCGVLISRRRTR